jgi:uncharacterized membrane protein YagU involved in acid resistance
MATLADRPLTLRSTLVGPIVAAGLIIAVLRQLDVFVVFGLLLKVPYIVQLQFIASGLLGVAAFAGGLGSAVLGLILHVVFSLVIAAVFMLAATRLPVLRRNLILGGLLYGVVVYFVMNFVVTPLSAAPPPEGISLAVIIEGIIGHALLVGLPLAFIARRNAINSN